MGGFAYNSGEMTSCVISLEMVGCGVGSAETVASSKETMSVVDTRFAEFLVERTFFGVCLMYAQLVVISGAKYFCTAAAVRKGQDAKKFCLIALIQELLVGKNAAACKYDMTLLVVERR